MSQSHLDPEDASKSGGSSPSATSENPCWRAAIVPYTRPHAGKATWQLVNTLGPYAAVWVILYFSLGVSWWLTAPLIVLAGGLLVRTFILFHDCGHGSFFASRVANDVWGFVTGLVCFTPYYHWRGEHASHHGTTGDLDRRGVGDIWTMTVQEYLEATRAKRWAYRLARNSLVLFVIAPIVVFVFLERFPRKQAKRYERHSVWWMNAALVAMIAGMSWIFGFVPYLIIQLAVLMVAGGVGVWLFYLQHQFEDAYWERGEDWDFKDAALLGSSYLKLPRILQWFSGNIGFHHIHHLSPRIPNYRLQRCHESHPAFRRVQPMTLLSSFGCLRKRLWDESSKKLVGFHHVRAARIQRDAT